MQNARISYFSATGNTARAVGIVGSRLEAAGYAVKTEVIVPGAKRAKDANEETDLEVFAFPVLAFSPPKFVRRFLRSLPKASGRKAAVLAVSGGGPAQAIQQAADILKRRGYDLALSGGAAYPANWTQVVAMAPDKIPAKLESGDREAEEFAEALISGGRREYRVGFGTVAWARPVGFLYGLFGRRMLGKAFIADGNCNSCGLCARSCPAKTIVMTGKTDAKPRWRFNCENCNRCINICPKRAIQTSNLRLGIHLVLNLAIFVISIMIAVGLVSGLSAPVAIPLGILAALAVSFIGTILEFGPLDRALFALARVPAFAKAFAKGYTADYPRYTAPGFRP